MTWQRMTRFVPFGDGLQSPGILRRQLAREPHSRNEGRMPPFPIELRVDDFRIHGIVSPDAGLEARNPRHDGGKHAPLVLGIEDPPNVQTLQNRCELVGPVPHHDPHL